MWPSFPVVARASGATGVRPMAVLSGRGPVGSAGARRPPAGWPIFVPCVAMLIWPALWNGYPIMFADTGTYLMQAMKGYLGWDRPAFYSVAIFVPHMRVTAWSVVLAQSWIAVFVLDLARRALGAPRYTLPSVCVFLAAATWFPWTVSELMPDLLTPLLCLLLGILLFAPAGFRAWELWAMTGLTAFAIAAQSSSIPLAGALLAVFLPAISVSRRCVGRRDAAAVRAPFPVLGPVAFALAILALVFVNLAGHGRAAISPFGNVFLLARVIYDGPGMAVLRRDCPASGWRLCPWLDHFPATSDEFLWSDASPIMRAGGHKAVSGDANAILAAAIRAEPVRLFRALLNNAAEQITRFESGDGLEAWPRQVAPAIDAAFPAWERAMFHAARQQNNSLSVPAPLADLHRAAAWGGIVAACLLLAWAWRRRHNAGWFLAMALLTLPVSAAVTGGLSTPHDRYQSRIVWLPACIALFGAPVLLRRRDSPDAP